MQLTGKKAPETVSIDLTPHTVATSLFKEWLDEILPANLRYGCDYDVEPYQGYWTGFEFHDIRRFNRQFGRECSSSEEQTYHAFMRIINVTKEMK